MSYTTPKQANSKLKDSQWTDNAWVCLAIAFAVAISIFAYSEVVVKYEKTTYNTNLYTDAEEQIALRLKVDSICKKVESKVERNRCSSAVELLKDHANLNDLAAQETVALATRGLLWIGFLQLVTMAFTLFFLVWAVKQSAGILKEARKTTDAAENATREAKRANAIQLSPYFAFDDVMVTWSNSSGAAPLCVTLRVKNTGASTAINIGRFNLCHLHYETFPISEDRDESGREFLTADLKRREGWEGSDSPSTSEPNMPTNSTRIQPSHIGHFRFFSHVEGLSADSVLLTMPDAALFPQPPSHPWLDANFTIYGWFEFTDIFRPDRKRICEVEFSKSTGDFPINNTDFVEESECAKIRWTVSERDPENIAN